MMIENILKNAINPNRKIAILGIGSELCGDDAAGMMLIHQLQKRICSDSVLLMPASTAPENFTGMIKEFEPDLLIVVDAVFAKRSVGEIFLVDLDEIQSIECSTHMMPLGFLLTYLQQETRSDYMMIGIQPKETEFATDPCSEIVDSVDRLANVIENCLK